MPASPPFRVLPAFSLLILVFIVVGCNVISAVDGPPAIQAAEIRETWTPTLQPTNLVKDQADGMENPSPKATSTPIRIVVPTPHVTPSQVATSTPLSESKPGDAAAVPSTPVAAKRNNKTRIDAMGPVPLETASPLAMGTGSKPIRLRIPALSLDTSVETMGWKVIRTARGTRSEWEVVDFAAGHHINSAYPGEAGNVVISGHNNIGGSVFRSVCVIGQPGVDFGLRDEIILSDEEGRHFTYKVNGWQRIKEANASIARRRGNAQWLDPTDFAQLTLVTCWPPWSNTHRVIVTALLTDKGQD